MPRRHLYRRRAGGLYRLSGGNRADGAVLGRNVERPAPWLAAACFCMFLYLFFGIVAYAIAVWLDPNSPVGIRDLISVEASGIFFGNLTPMMMGSTPAQIYRLTKAGQNVGEAGATQFTRFIVYQFGLVAWRYPTACSHAVFCRALWRHDAAVRL